MAISVDDEDQLLTTAFSLHANPGAYAVLVGAGVSRPSGMPTAWEVLTDLVSRVAELSGDGPPSADPIAWYEQRYGEQPRYETLLERLAPSALERQRLLRSYFEPPDPDADTPDRRPTVAHQAIARLVRAGVVRIVVTLNFDRLIEQAIRQAGLEPTIVATPSDVVALAPLHTLECCVVHLHGDYLTPASMLNTTAELETYAPETQRLLGRILEDYGLIIAGWSATYDPALREALKQHYPSRFTMAWIEPYAPSAVAADLASLMKARVVSTDADTALGRLADSVESLTLRRARHPLTVAVAAETAKRELAGRWVAIRLHDTLGAEFDRLRAIPELDLPDYQSAAPYGGYGVVAGRVEEASKVPAALVAALAYWGGSDTDRWWLDEVHRFSLQQRGGGETRLLTLRLIAGSMLFYAGGTAAVAAKRYDLVAALLALHRPSPYRAEPDPLARVLAGDSVIDDSNASGGRMYASVRAILTTALSLGLPVVDDALQTFEILRLASLVISNERFEKLASEFADRDRDCLYAEQAVEQAEAGQGDPDGARQAQAGALQERDRVLGRTADLVRPFRPHVLTADTYGEGRDRWCAPVADRLARDVDTEGHRNRLVQSGLRTDPASLSLALKAVSVAVGRAGREMSWRRVDRSVGAVPGEIWLDTGQTPYELHSANP